jgi:hypothetical protein
MINVRRKGLAFERYIAAAMRMIGYSKAHRQLEFQINNALGIDLAETGPYKIQCKKTKKYVPMNTINEVKAKEGEIPVLIAAGDGEPPLVTMHLEHWLYLVSHDLANPDTNPLMPQAIKVNLGHIRKGHQSGKEES